MSLRLSGFLFLLYILPTYFIYSWLRGHIVAWDEVMNMNLLLVAIAWCSIPATFFLNYYASFGITAIFWTSVGRGFRSPKRTDNWKNRVVITIAILILFTTGYNFFTTLYQLIIGQLPSIVLQNPSGGITRIIGWFIQNNPLDSNREQSFIGFEQFITVFPLDLLIFFVSVCVVSIFGFYSRFLSRETSQPAGSRVVCILYHGRNWCKRLY